MDKDGQSFSLQERTPLINRKEVVDLYSKVTKPEKHTSGTACEPGPAAAGTSSTCSKDEASSSAVLNADISKKCQGNDEEELAEHISSYEGMAHIVSPETGCGLYYGIWLYVGYCLSSFLIQFPLHAALLTLPIVIGYKGARYMTQCPMSPWLPYAVMVLGCFGTLALLVRLALLLHTKFSNDERLKKWLEKGMRFMEFDFLLSLICEMCFLYNRTHSDDPLSSQYCERNFYNFTYSLNDILMALVVVWTFVYFISRQCCRQRVVPP